MAMKLTLALWVTTTTILAGQHFATIKALTEPNNNMSLAGNPTSRGFGRTSSSVILRRLPELHRGLQRNAAVFQLVNTIQKGGTIPFFWKHASLCLLCI